MRRFAAILSFFVFSVSFAILALPLAAACPVQDPIPLRGLYLKSDVVVVAKIGAPGKWEMAPRDEDSADRYRIYRRGIPLQVEETIKGSGTSNLVVAEERWHWLGNADDTQAATPNPVKEAEPEFESTLADNKDRRLFFLSKNEEGVNYSQVIRNHPFEPTQKELEVYISRLRELGNIYSAANPSKASIVEWLVSMAEDPVTRFEGAYELREALENVTDDEEEEEAGGEEKRKAVLAVDASPAADDSSETEQTDPKDVSVEVENVSSNQLVYRNYGGDGDLAKLLTADQKERLVRAFLNVRFNYERVKDEDAEEDDEGYVEVLNDADSELLGAVSRLKDRRVIDRLLAEIPTVARYQSWEASQMMDTIAGYFDDDKLTKLAEKYSDVGWGGEDDLIPDQGKAYDKPEAGEAGETAGDNAAQVKTVTANSKDGREDNAKASEPKIQLPPKTYGQRRTELLDRIMLRCSELVVMAKKE